eukprot:7192971-Alexandrium_andersonii.AAC.1
MLPLMVRRNRSGGLADRVVRALHLRAGGGRFLQAGVAQRFACDGREASPARPTAADRCRPAAAGGRALPDPTGHLRALSLPR